MKAFAILIVIISISASAAGAGQGPAGAGPIKRNRVLDPVLNEKYEYYEVCGSCEKDLRCDLELKAIKCNDGKKYDSVTNWKITWDYGRDRDSKTCTTEAFTVTVDVTFRLPKWKPNARASQQFADKWSTYTKNVLTHETGHRDRTVAAATELTRMIADLPPAGTCSELDREVNRIARARVNKLAGEQAEYDRATSHGRSQGIMFP